MKFTCPSCWSKHQIQAGMLSIVCQYCNSVSKVERDVLVETWEKSIILPFPTLFSVWKVFYAIAWDSFNSKFIDENVEYISEEEFYRRKLKDYLVKIYIAWEVRYLNDWWFRDDWFVRVLDSKINIDLSKDLILTESEWLISSMYIKKISDTIQGSEIMDYEVWSTYEWLFVQETWKFKVEWFSWSFPILIDWQKEGRFVSLVWEDMRFEFKQIWDYVLFLNLK